MLTYLYFVLTVSRQCTKSEGHTMLGMREVRGEHLFFSDNKHLDPVETVLKLVTEENYPHLIKVS